MSILNRCKKLVSPAFNGGVLLEQTGVLRSVCSAPKVHYHVSAQRIRTRLLSGQCWYHFDNSRLVTRFYSEVCNDSRNSERNSDVFKEETGHDSVRSHRSPATFSLDVLVSLLRQENAVDICVIKVPEQLTYANYFIVVSGVSARHLRAMALYAIKVYKFLKKDGDPNVKIEGKDADDWMCIDFGNMVVHFMLPETREVYELEKLWTLRAFDEQLKNMPDETLPEDFIYDADVTK